MSVQTRNVNTRPIVAYVAMALGLVLFQTSCNRDPAQAASAQAVADQQTQQGTNPVIHWTTLVRELMIDPGPVIDSRAYAIYYAALHDALNGVERRYEPYTADLSAPNASIDAAVATAAHDVLVALSPSTSEKTESAYTQALAGIPEGAAKQQGVKLGQAAARANVARRTNDSIAVGAWPPLTGPITQPVYVPTGAPGDYAFTPPFDAPPFGPIALFPGWGRLTPFAADLSKHSVPGPDALTSDEYARDVQLLESVGALRSTARTPDQTATAFFWFEEFGILNQITGRVLEQVHADPWDAARTLALTHLAIADAGIACMAAKYEFRFWRPYTAIRRADEDGNPQTKPNREWLPLLWTPLENPEPVFMIPPIPDYPSAAATLSHAWAAVVGATLGDAHAYDATSPFLPGATRHFTSFSQAAKEASMSRVFGGIHFRRAVEDGAELGTGIGKEVAKLLPPARP